MPFVAPYHLPRVIEAARSGKSLIICEGEKDVETVERVLEMAATCNPFGAGKWGIDWPTDWGKWFQGLKSILIIADKDAETIKRKKRGKMVEEPFLTGQKHAWDVYRKLQAAGVTAKVLGGRAACREASGRQGGADGGRAGVRRLASRLAIHG